MSASRRNSQGAPMMAIIMVWTWQRSPEPQIPRHERLGLDASWPALAKRKHRGRASVTSNRRLIARPVRLWVEGQQNLQDRSRASLPRVSVTPGDRTRTRSVSLERCFALLAALRPLAPFAASRSWLVSIWPEGALRAIVLQGCWDLFAFWFLFFVGSA